MTKKKTRKWAQRESTGRRTRLADDPDICRRVTELYHQYGTITAVAEQLPYSADTVRRLLAYLGVRSPAPRKRKLLAVRQTYVPLLAKEPGMANRVSDLYTKLGSVEAVARETGRLDITIRRLLTHLGVVDIGIRPSRVKRVSRTAARDAEIRRKVRSGEATFQEMARLHQVSLSLIYRIVGPGYGRRGGQRKQRVETQRPDLFALVHDVHRAIGRGHCLQQVALRHRMNYEQLMCHYARGVIQFPRLTIEKGR